VVWQDPGLLLTENGTNERLWALPGEVDFAAGSIWTAIFRGLASRRVRIEPTAIASVARTAEGRLEIVRRVEQLSCQLRPYEVVMRFGTALHQRVAPDDESGPLGGLMSYLHDVLLHETGVAFPRVLFENDASLDVNGYAIIVAGLPRAFGTIPDGMTFTNATPEFFANSGTIEPYVNPATASIGSWVADEALEPVHDVVTATWDASGFVVLQLAACLREAAHEFADAAWAQQHLDRLSEDEALRPFVELVRTMLPRESLAWVMSRLVAESVNIRDVRLLER
jgi:type III secretory pathway component EscV